MNRSPIPLMRDFRNIKKNNTITFAMTSKELPTSTKDLKKARSSEQINLRGLIEVQPTLSRIKMRRSRTSIRNLTSTRAKSNATISSLNSSPQPSKN